MIRKIIVCAMALSAALPGAIPAVAACGEQPPGVISWAVDIAKAQYNAEQLAANFESNLAEVFAMATAQAGDIDVIARIIYTEARGVESDTEKAAVVWCILNRVDDSRWPNTIRGAATQRHQFAWCRSAPVQAHLRRIAQDVFIDWQMEKRGYDVQRVLPREYVFFSGHRGRNWFRTTYKLTGSVWKWTLPSPYDN